VNESSWPFVTAIDIGLTPFIKPVNIIVGADRLAKPTAKLATSYGLVKPTAFLHLQLNPIYPSMLMASTKSH
jgi:hypothetical protein